MNPRNALRKISPWGQWSTPVLIGRTLANNSLDRHLLRHLCARGAKDHERHQDLAGVPTALAEMEIALATAQNILTRLGVRLGDFMAVTYEQSHELMKDYQTAKWVVNRHAIDIASQGIDLSGGESFMLGNPLSRLYRNVRANPFMQPYSPIDARDYVGNALLQAFPEV